MLKSVNVNFCDKVTTIPQFGGTCWFNAILMATLYSQGSRAILLKLSENWDKKNKFLMIIKTILLKNYINNEKTKKYLSKLKPEAILFKMISLYNDKALKDHTKLKIKLWELWYEPLHDHFVSHFDAVRTVFGGGTTKDQVFVCCLGARSNRRASLKSRLVTS